MDLQTTDASSLSFVDVLANGLGGLLILFILTTAVQTDIDFAKEGKDKGVKTKKDGTGRGDNQKDPFVALVIGPPRVPILNEPKDPWRATRRTDERYDYGATFAVMHGPNPPTGDLALDNLRPGIRLTVSIFVHGEPAGTRSQIVPPSGSIKVWPPDDR